MKAVTLKSLKNSIRRNEEFVNGVVVRNNEHIEKALKRFKRVVESAGVIYDIKNYRYFSKPSEKRKEAIKTAKRKALQENK